MKRLLVFALAMSLGQSSVAFAGETLLESAKRVTRQITDSQPAQPKKIVLAAKPVVQPYASQGQVSDPSLENSGMRKRTKWMIALGAVMGFAGVVYAIDHGVEDVTPSTLGTRGDGL